MLGKRIQYLLLLLFIGCLYVFLDGYFLLLFLLAVLFLPLGSLGHLLLVRGKVSLSADAPLTLEGAPEIAYILENGSRLPTPALAWELSLKNNLSGGSTNQSLRGFLPGRSKEEARLSLLNARTGKITAVTKKAKISDFLGLFSFPLTLPAVLNVYIYPELYEIGQIGFSRVEADGDSVNYSQKRPGADVNEIFALHEYAEGDDLRKIHWKLSSKTDVLMVRDFGLPLNSQVTVLLELMSGSSGQEGELSLGLDILASLSSALAREGIVHNIAWFDQEFEVFQIEQISEFGELQTALPLLLEATAYEDEPHALLSYLQRGDAGNGIMLYYITTCLDNSLITAAVEAQAVKIILVSAGDVEPSWPKELDVVRVGTDMQSELVIQSLTENFGS